MSAASYRSNPVARYLQVALIRRRISQAMTSRLEECLGACVPIVELPAVSSVPSCWLACWLACWRPMPTSLWEGEGSPLLGWTSLVPTRMYARILRSAEGIKVDTVRGLSCAVSSGLVERGCEGGAGPWARYSE